MFRRTITAGLLGLALLGGDADAARIRIKPRAKIRMPKKMRPKVRKAVRNLRDKVPPGGRRLDAVSFNVVHRGGRVADQVSVIRGRQNWSVVHGMTEAVVPTQRLSLHQAYGAARDLLRKKGGGFRVADLDSVRIRTASGRRYVAGRSSGWEAVRTIPAEKIFFPLAAGAGLVAADRILEQRHAYPTRRVRSRDVGPGTGDGSISVGPGRSGTGTGDGYSQAAPQEVDTPLDGWDDLPVR